MGVLIYDFNDADSARLGVSGNNKTICSCLKKFRILYSVLSNHKEEVRNYIFFFFFEHIIPSHISYLQIYFRIFESVDKNK